MPRASLTAILFLLAAGCSDARRPGASDAVFAADLPILDGGRTTLAAEVIEQGRMLYPRSHHAALRLSGGRVLVVGGADGRGILAECEVYDPRTREFLATAPMNLPRIGHVALTLGDGSVVVAGGFDGRHLLDSVEVFRPGPRFAEDPSDARWDVVPTPLAFPRSRHRAVALPGMAPTAMMLHGGVTGRGGDAAPTNGCDIFILDPDGDGDVSDARSRFAAQPRFARTGHSLSLLPGPDGATGTPDDWVLAYGGLGADPFDPQSKGLVVLGEPELYVPWQDRWHAVEANRWYPEAPQQAGVAGDVGFAGPRKDHRAVLLSGGLLLLVGGSNARPGPPAVAGNGLVRRSEIFVPDYSDPSAGRFRSGPSLPTPRQDPAVAAIDHGRALVIGGYDGGRGIVLADALLYEPAAGPDEARFRPFAALRGGRIYHSATLLDAGTVLLVGGLGPTGAPMRIGERILVDRAVAVAR